MRRRSRYRTSPTPAPVPRAACLPCWRSSLPRSLIFVTAWCWLTRSCPKMPDESATEAAPTSSVTTSVRAGASLSCFPVPSRFIPICCAISAWLSRTAEAPLMSWRRRFRRMTIEPSLRLITSSLPPPVIATTSTPSRHRPSPNHSSPSTPPTLRSSACSTAWA